MTTKFLAGVLFICATSSIIARGNPESSSDLLEGGDASGTAAVTFTENQAQTEARSKMVSEQIEARGIEDPKVLEAMRMIPRHLFIPADVRGQAYDDNPVPIGAGQTISQPYIVALMTEALELQADDKVLEIGTGSGYQGAVLSFIVESVYSIEIREPLYERATRTFEELRIQNVETLHADGYYGWEMHAPFDAIMITAAVDHIPHPLLDQLADGGRMILPFGDPYGFQDLVLVRKTGDQFSLEYITGVLFVPMTGRALE